MIHTGGLAARLALIISLALAWLNLLLTARWAAVPGSVNGPKYPFYVAALTLASVLAWRVRGQRVQMSVGCAAVCACGGAVLLFGFFIWFPLETWSRIPFLDDWPPRFQSTLEGVRLVRHGTFSGWRWSFLGGYPIATDVTQDLTIWAALPMWLFGSAVGFHLTHLVLFAAIPLLVWLDVRIDGAEAADVALLAAGLAAIFAVNYSYFLIRSGDTNSLAGVVAALATLAAAHAARAGRRGASLAMVAALTIANYSHRGFFVYTLLFLALDAAIARDWRSAVRGALATLAALCAALPLTWDLWRHPSYFIVNNVELHPASFAWAPFIRKVYYNVELLVRPGRWFNDYTGLTNVFLPVVALTAWQARGRIRFYAAATLGVVALVRLNYDAFGYAFLRPVHLLPIFIAPVLAWFILRRSSHRSLAFSLIALLALYIQMWLLPVPHVTSVREFDRQLVERVAELDGNLVLIENAFHRDVDASPSRSSVPTPFDAHFESLLPDATGRRFYAGMWDGWQWTPYRDQVFANGTFRGRALTDVPVTDVTAELQKWGIRHLVVWSEPAKEYLRSMPGFTLRWQTNRWQQFEFLAADGRSVDAGRGTGVLEALTPGGAVVRLSAVRSGDRIVVRTNYHPAWRARLEGVDLAVFGDHGQLAFTAPRDGEYVVSLEYPRRLWLLPLALIMVVAAVKLIQAVSPASKRAGDRRP